MSWVEPNIGAASYLLRRNIHAKKIRHGFVGPRNYREAGSGYSPETVNNVYNSEVEAARIGVDANNMIVATMWALLPVSFHLCMTNEIISTVGRWIGYRDALVPNDQVMPRVSDKQYGAQLNLGS